LLRGAPDKRYELVNGALIDMGGSGGRQAILALRIARYLDVFVDDNNLGYVTGADGAYIIARDPDTVRIPDAAFISKARMPLPMPVKFIPLAPDLAVEVVSPGDTAMEVRAKVLEYLRGVTRLVWVIYPETQSADVYSGLDQWRVVDLAGALDGGEVLPGFSLPLVRLFKGVDETS
jgi:Uma2 family endonuclease